MKKHRWILPAFGGLLVAALVFWLWPRPLTVTHYTLQTELSAPIRIVQLSDLHSRSFGDNNMELIDLVEKQAPDLIFLTGDMINRNTEDLTDLCLLCTSLSDIAPTYYSYGNHEVDWEEETGTELREILTDCGVHVLELEYEDCTVNGQALRIGGYAGYYRTPQMDTNDRELRRKKLTFADDFENTDRQKLLLAHIATSWLDWKRVNDHPVGVVFCGHYHGGQIRFPLIDRGLYAPYAGWFPKYTRGVYQGAKAICILSAGLGSGWKMPRIYNPPEIVVAELIPAEYP